MSMVDATLNGNFRAQAESRGYIVIEPAAPNDVLFFEGSEKIFPAFLTRLLSDYHIAGGKFNVAGNSNGGLSAFLIAAKYPQYFVDRKSTRLNSSHRTISYAVFCLKKKKKYRSEEYRFPH